MSDTVHAAGRFNALPVYLRRPQVLSASKAMLMRVLFKTWMLGGPERQATPATMLTVMSVREFLAGYFIEFYPEHALDNAEPTVPALVEATHAVLPSFAFLVGELEAEGKLKMDKPETAEAAKAFVGLIHTYHAAFIAWQVPDQARLMARIGQELHRLISYTLDDDDALVLNSRVYTAAERAAAQAQMERMLGFIAQRLGARGQAEIQAMLDARVAELRGQAAVLRQARARSPAGDRMEQMHAELRRLTQAADRARPQSAEHITLRRRAHRLRVRISRGVA